MASSNQNLHSFYKTIKPIKKEVKKNQNFVNKNSANRKFCFCYQYYKWITLYFEKVTVIRVKVLLKVNKKTQ